MNKLEKLLIACKNGNIEKVKKLIKSSFFSKGADVNGIGLDGYSPLMWALKNNNHEVQSLLVSNGADLNACDKNTGISPLENAVKLGNIELIELLLSNGVDINHESNKTGNTPLSHAINNEKLEIAKYLISKGANVNAKVGLFGDPLLSWAIRNKQDKIINLLISEGADVNLKNIKGNTPIMVSLLEIQGFLDSKYNTSGFFGNVTIQICIEYMEFIKLLISKGADPDIRNDNRESPYRIIQKLKSSFPEISELEVIINSIENDFINAKGGADLAKLIRTHSIEDVERFCKNYQFEDIKLNDGLSKDVNRFEGITILAEIIMDYERVSKEDPGAKLPSDFPHNQLKDILIKRIIDFLKKQTNIDIAPIYRTRIHDFAMSLMGIKDYRNAIECLKISKPSLKGDDEFWLAACYFNIANSGSDKNDISEAISVISKLIKSNPNLPNQALETLDKMHNILIEK